MEPTYENVEPLLARSKVNGKVMEYLFRCPVTHFEITGLAAIPQPTAPGMVTVGVGAVVGAEVSSSAQAHADSVLPGAGLVAGIAESVFGFRRSEKKRHQLDRQAQVIQQQMPEQLLLAAFATVANAFRWDADGARWVMAGG